MSEHFPGMVESTDLTRLVAAGIEDDTVRAYVGEGCVGWKWLDRTSGKQYGSMIEVPSDVPQSEIAELLGHQAYQTIRAVRLTP